ncbi:MAG: RNA-binding protein [Rhodobacteraceae bacterium]|nr:RNA-binding protein [Paracoccaceae bacterium]
MTRGGRSKIRGEPERRCIATGEVLPMAALIRFVVGPDRVIVVDVTGKLPGRGIWVAADRTAIQKAVNKRLFARSAKQAVEVPATLVQNVEVQLLRHLTGLIALARKSGQAFAGFEKVKEAATKGSVAVLLQACDGSAAQKAKIRPNRGKTSVISCLSAKELGVAFGRENVIHAALAAGGLSERIVEGATRLAGVRNGLVPNGADASGTGPEQEGAKDV